MGGASGRIKIALLITRMVLSTAAGFQASPWSLAHATFYGYQTASQAMGGACGYGNVLANGYGTDTAALSTVLFKNGHACGECYQLRCVGSKNCYRGSPIVTVSATNLCPPNWAEDSDNGGWCNPPRTHFDMSKPAFMKIANWKAGIIPIMYRRVPCAKNGGLRFRFEGNGFWLLVYVMNVGGAGDISSMSVKGSRTAWIAMTHNWGASYQASPPSSAKPSPSPSLPTPPSGLSSHPTSLHPTGTSASPTRLLSTSPETSIHPFSPSLSI